MRILNVCEYYQHLGGSEQYALSTADELERLGHELGFLYGTGGRETIKHPGRQERLLPAVRGVRPLAVDEEAALDGFLSDWPPDVVFLHNVSNPHLIRRVSVSFPCVRFVHDHRLFCPVGSRLRWPGVRCKRRAGLSCILYPCLSRHKPLALWVWNESLAAHRHVRLVVASHYMRDSLAAHGFASESISVLPLFADLADPVAREPGDFILFVGRIERVKGLQVLVRALAQLPRDARLVVAGDGSHLGEVRRLSDRLGLGPRIGFLGQVGRDRLQLLYEQCIFVAVPALWDEPFGLVGLEAMRCAKPVLASNVGGIPDWLTDGVNGYLVPPGDVGSLVWRARMLLDNRERATAMGLEGQRMYGASFSKAKHVHGLLEVLETAIGSFGAAPPPWPGPSAGVPRRRPL